MRYLIFPRELQKEQYSKRVKMSNMRKICEQMVQMRNKRAMSKRG